MNRRSKPGLATRGLAFTKRFELVGRTFVKVSLKTCLAMFDSAIGFSKEFTETSLDEIKSVVMEFAPDGSFSERFSTITSSVSEPIQSAYERVQYEADEHPVATSGVVFVAGLALGILGTVTFS